MHYFSLLLTATVHLRPIVFYISCATILFVFTLLLFISIKHKKANYTEITWSLIPFIMLFLLLIPIVTVFFTS
ncbi:MAG: hypothetical protein A3E82_04090 [Gammaproteobacteria bacterium RIFCSPHIGHO2_12_FULL_38_11]|nr:MAG: hypothetical protein A3E82_04090 [Gammaproteobacteria bacterium RIFCSPHIGHO2_12_FULL_38_11]